MVGGWKKVSAHSFPVAETDPPSAITLGQFLATAAGQGRMSFLGK
jgi:hypothetical protein